MHYRHVSNMEPSHAQHQVRPGEQLSGELSTTTLAEIDPVEPAHFDQLLW